MSEATSLSKGEGVAVPNITFSLSLDKLIGLIGLTQDASASAAKV